jgi:hypothetical protein
MQLCGIAKESGEVRDPRIVGTRLESINHSLLDVDADCLAARQHSLCGWNQQSAWTRAYLQDALSRLQMHAVERC